MTGILLIGGGGHCKAAIDVIEADGQFEIKGIVERAGVGGEVLGYPIIGEDADLPHLVKATPAALVTIGQIKTSSARQRAFTTVLNAGAALPSIVSPKAHVSGHADVGAGTLVMHGAVINAAAQVGANCILNSLSLVEHDAIVGDHCHISTGARVNGDAKIGERCFIGSGAIIKNGVTIGAGSVVGAGCIIGAALPPNSFIRSTP